MRLVGPKPTRARRDGGEAGLHPSNIHDNAYASSYVAWLRESAESTTKFKACQQAAFEAERERWHAAGQDLLPSQSPVAFENGEQPVAPQGCLAITSPIAGSVWRLAAEAGATVHPGASIVIVEAMKTEIAVISTRGGIVERLLVSPGHTVAPGQIVAFVRPLPS